MKTLLNLKLRLPKYEKLHIYSSKKLLNDFSTRQTQSTIGQFHALFRKLAGHSTTVPLYLNNWILKLDFFFAFPQNLLEYIIFRVTSYIRPGASPCKVTSCSGLFIFRRTFIFRKNKNAVMKFLVILSCFVVAAMAGGVGKEV